MSKVQLMLGDCLERMKEIPDGSVDMILTDPPYGIDFQSQWKKDSSKWLPKIANDKKPFIDFIELAADKMKADGCMITFCRFDSWQEFADECERVGLKVKSQIVWDKVVHGMGDLKGATALQHELALFVTKGKFKFHGKRQKSIVKHIRVSPKDIIHPNQKPVDLMEELISGYCKEGGLVLDMFTGVSPVGVAAKNLNRDFIGIEMDEGYFKIAKERIEQA